MLSELRSDPPFSTIFDLIFSAAAHSVTGAASRPKRTSSFYIKIDNNEIDIEYSFTN